MRANLSEQSAKFLKLQDGERMFRPLLRVPRFAYGLKECPRSLVNGPRKDDRSTLCPEHFGTLGVGPLTPQLRKLQYHYLDFVHTRRANNPAELAWLLIKVKCQRREIRQRRSTRKDKIPKSVREVGGCDSD